MPEETNVEAIKSKVANTIYKNKLKKKLGEKCAFCGCTNKLILTIDHKQPKHRGGNDDDSNKQVLCYICNQLKDKLTMPEFRKYMASLYTMKELCKVRLILPPKIDLVFNQNHFPQRPEDIGNKGIVWEKGNGDVK